MRICSYSNIECIRIISETNLNCILWWKSRCCCRGKWVNVWERERDHSIARIACIHFAEQQEEWERYVEAINWHEGGRG